MSEHTREFWRMKTMLKGDGFVRFVDERSTREELIDLMPSESTRNQYDYKIHHIRETILSEETIGGDSAALQAAKGGGDGVQD